MLIKFCFFLLLVFFYHFSFAQINNSILENNVEINDSLSQKLLLEIGSKNFFKNNEYFGKIATGYTLMSSQFGTQIAYLPNKNVRLQAGVLLQHDFGNKQKVILYPVMTCKLQKNGYSILFGTLEGNVAHRLIDPIYDYEKLITHPVENGFQIKIDKPKVWNDTWLQWNVMQYLGSTYQEEFTVGNSSRFTLFENKFSKIILPFQMFISHKGGQIDVDTTSLKTFSNGAIGLQYIYRVHKSNAFLSSISTENYFTFFKDLSPSKNFIFKKGSAFYANVTLHSKYHLDASIGYWNGTDYYAYHGSALFQSINSAYTKTPFIAHHRELLFLRLLYTHKVFNVLNVSVRFEPYYDLGAKLFEYNYGIYFLYKHDFTLFNLLKRK